MNYVQLPNGLWVHPVVVKALEDYEKKKGKTMITICECGADIKWKGSGTRCPWCGRVWEMTVAELTGKGKRS